MRHDSISIQQSTFSNSSYAFLFEKKMLIDEFVDGGLIGRLDFFELQTHSYPPVTPRDA